MWSVLQDRDSVVWNFLGPEEEGSEFPFYLCWPAQIADMRSRGTGIYFSYLDEDQLPLHGEVGTLTAGWGADSPRDLAVVLEERFGVLYSTTGKDLEGHPWHAQAVLGSVFDLLMDMSVANGDPLDPTDDIVVALTSLAISGDEPPPRPR